MLTTVTMPRIEDFSCGLRCAVLPLKLNDSLTERLGIGYDVPLKIRSIIQDWRSLPEMRLL